MGDFVVTGDSRLDDFLRGQAIQLWRVPILAANGGVEVLRGKAGSHVDLKAGSATPLKAKDIVRTVAKLSTACGKALQQEADTNWRDYAIAPGTTPFDDRMRKFLQVREKTILIDTSSKGDPSMADLQGFLKGIATSNKITNPIRDLIVVGHGSGITGEFKIPLTSGAKDDINYEDLENAVKQKTLHVDIGLMMPRPAGSNPIPQMRLFGCTIGRAAPYMKKLKEALGNTMIVIAPNHLLRAADLGPGELAYMAYPFRVYLPPPPTPAGKKRPTRTKTDLVAAYVAATDAETASIKAAGKPPTVPGRYVLQDWTPVTKKLWDSWLPKAPEDSRWFPSNPFKPLPKPDPHEIANSEMLAVFKFKRNVPQRYECRLAHQLFRNPVEVPLKQDPATPAARNAAMKHHIQQDPIWQDNHPFPGYVRFGYNTMDEFMDGCGWQFAYDKQKQVLTGDPIRDEYALAQPITKNAVLMMNFYQNIPPPPKYKGQFPIVLLRIEDRFYFTAY